jgi:hypothetical protein
MTEHTSRNRGTAARTNTPSNRPGSDSTPRRAPGHEAPRTALGEDAYLRLVRQQHERGTVLGELADVVLGTAAEADRFHGKLRRYAAHVRDLLNPHLNPAFVPVTGLLQNTAHTTDLHAARFAQQMNQLTQVLDSYQVAARRTGL